VVVGKVFHFNLFFEPILPKSPAAQLSKRRSRSNSVCPGTKEEGLFEGPKVSINLQEDVLQYIVRRVRPYETEYVLGEDCLHPFEQFFERLTIPGLGEEN
jgi:hypothetical protein